MDQLGSIHQHIRYYFRLIQGDLLGWINSKKSFLAHFLKGVISKLKSLQLKRMYKAKSNASVSNF